MAFEASVRSPVRALTDYGVRLREVAHCIDLSAALDIRNRFSLHIRQAGSTKELCGSRRCLRLMRSLDAAIRARAASLRPHITSYASRGDADMHERCSPRTMAEMHPVSQGRSQPSCAPRNSVVVSWIIKRHVTISLSAVFSAV